MKLPVLTLPDFAVRGCWALSLSCQRAHTHYDTTRVTNRLVYSIFIYLFIQYCKPCTGPSRGSKKVNKANTTELITFQKHQIEAKGNKESFQSVAARGKNENLNKSVRAK